MYGSDEGASANACGPALWGGIEATVNRVGDEFFDQLRRNGHHERESDLDLLAGLGIEALRYPVLWERTAPRGLEHADWSWPERRLARLRELGVEPIVGLVHHGSGPASTSLVSSDFAPGLAAYAGEVARRFPDVRWWTPVNEPLTTARFCGLYGHWFPHGRDASVFARALVEQCRATVLAMRAIREHAPDALLVQTEDLGKTHSTPALEYQARFENERRWLSFDLLCGRIDTEHPMWPELVAWGIAPHELRWFVANPCPPDVMGINHYLTSERFLDEDLSAYPPITHGGNAFGAYADVEAVRVCSRGIDGPYRLLREVWERYGLPLAVTEAHLHCTREEQLRWLHEIWSSARSLACEGVPLRAVTVWSLLGAYDWNSLLARQDGHYEPGAFDLRAPKPRATAIAQWMKALGRGRCFDHPALDRSGWWHRPERMLHAPAERAPAQRPCTDLPAAVEASGPRSDADAVNRSERRLLVLGATGTLGRAFDRVCTARGLPVLTLARADADLEQLSSLERALDEHEPWAVINAAGWVRVDEAQAQEAACQTANAHGAAVLARLCAARGLPLVCFSSDLVFDGSKGEPYLESDPVAPLNAYGRSKARCEEIVLQAHSGALVARTSAFFGPWDTFNFVSIALREMRAGRRFAAMDDACVSPTYVPDLVHTSLDLLIDDESGIWHLANPGAVTWAELASRVAERAGLDPDLVEGRPTHSFGLAAPRPLYSVLGSERATLMRPLEEALEAFFVEVEEPDKREVPVCSVAGPGLNR